MTNDIVAQLREQTKRYDDCNCAGCQIKVKAADEIERLRIEADNLKAENQRLSQIARY